MSKRSHKTPALWRHPRVLWRRVFRSWPFFVWLVAIGASLYFYGGSARFSGMLGIVETPAEDIAPVDTARLINISTELGAKVKAGDPVAHMDTSLVDAQLAQLDATMFEAESSIGNFERSTLSIVQQFENDIRNAEASISDLKRRKQRDEAQLAALNEQQAKLDELVKHKLIDEQQASALRPQIAGLEFEVRNYPELIAIEKHRLEGAMQGREELAKSLRLGAGETIEDAIRRRAEAQRAILDAGRKAAVIQREARTLRATRDGVVSRIYHTPGDVISAGEPVVRVVDEHSNRIFGFLPDIYLSDVQPNQNVTVRRQNGRGMEVDGVIISIAPEIQAFPGRVSPIQGQTLRGRRVLVDLTSPHDFIPGETVRVATEVNPWAAIKHNLQNLFR